MLLQPTVMKFGGSSLEDRAAFERVTRIVGSYDRVCSVVVVVSAMSSMTADLLASAHLSARGAIREAIELLEIQRRRHLALTLELPRYEANKVESFIENVWRELVCLLQEVRRTRAASQASTDAVISYGEVLSAKLLTAILQAEGLPAFYVDARRCIVTDQDHGRAKPLLKSTRRRTRAEIIPLLESGKIPILGGFIATSKNGVPTTLGRGASDYTATLVSAAIGARETQIWTDVDGILTADPNVVESARSIACLSYAEAAELSRFGAKVLHPKSIEPLAEQNLPLRVFNSRSPEFPGTLVCDSHSEPFPIGIKAIACKTNQTAIHLKLTRAYGLQSLSRAIQKTFRQHHLTADIIALTETVVMLACEQTDRLASIIRELERFGPVTAKSDRALICCLVSEDCDLDGGVNWLRVSGVSVIAELPQVRARQFVRDLHHHFFGDQVIPRWYTHDRISAMV